MPGLYPPPAPQQLSIVGALDACLLIIQSADYCVTYILHITRCNHTRYIVKPHPHEQLLCDNFYVELPENGSHMVYFWGPLTILQAKFWTAWSLAILDCDVLLQTEEQ